MDDGSAALLFNILELAGTPQAQRVLADAMENGSLSPANRFRSMVAMAGLEQPTEETIERLTRAGYSLRSGEDELDLASTATLVLGAVTRQAPGEEAARVRDGLRDALRGAADPNRQMVVLTALANARASMPPEDLSQYLQSDSPGVRAAAAGILAANPSPAGTEELVGLLSRERQPLVLSATIGALPRATPDPQINAAVARALVQDGAQDATVRREMVGYLAGQMATFPGNRTVLESALRHETNRGVMVAILSALAR